MNLASDALLMRGDRGPGPRGLGRACGLLAVVAMATAAAAGCGDIDLRIAEIQQRHGVVLTVTAAARQQDLLGGSAYAMVENVGKELAAFPRLATAGRRIHVAATADLLAVAYPEEFFDALLSGAATQDHPGPDQGDVYVLNKNLLGLYVDLFQPGTMMLRDPRLRHELAHAIEIDALRDMMLADPWEAVLDESPEMVRRMGLIDALAMEMPGALRAAAGQAAPLAEPHPSLLTARHEPYLDLCARWLAAHFGDVTGDGRTDDADAVALRANPAAFDVDGDGRLTYADAAARTGLRHSMRRGSDPVSQAEMTAGVLGYRPRGFASPYGRTAPWEDKAEVLDLAVRRGMLPHLFAAPLSLPGVTDKSIAEAEEKLESLRREDPVLARKVEIMAIYLGNLVPPAERGTAFAARYGAAMVPYDRVTAGDEDSARLAAARRGADARRLAASPHIVTMQGTTASVVILPPGSAKRTGPAPAQ